MRRRRRGIVHSAGRSVRPRSRPPCGRARPRSRRKAKNNSEYVPTGHEVLDERACALSAWQRRVWVPSSHFCLSSHRATTIGVGPSPSARVRRRRLCSSLSARYGRTSSPARLGLHRSAWPLVPIIEEGTKRVASRCDEDHRFWIFDWAAGPPQALIRSCWDCLRTGRQNVMAVKVELGAPRRYSSKTIKQESVSCSASLAFSIASVRRHPLPSRWYSVSFRIKRAAQGRI